MIEQRTLDSLGRRLVPPIAAVIAIGTFVSLGLWQLDRADEKEATAALFADDAPYRDLSGDETPQRFERVSLRGRLDIERPVLIDNIVKNGRLGYYVVVMLERPQASPVLVNLGWVAKTDTGAPDLAVLGAASSASVRGRAGLLPRVGIRPSEAFIGQSGWPRIGVYPTIDEVGAELGETLAPFALLLAPDVDGGFVRDWAPVESGAMTHYGYAFQWFAMAIAVVIISAWQLRKLRRKSA